MPTVTPGCITPSYEARYEVAEPKSHWLFVEPSWTVTACTSPALRPIHAVGAAGRPPLKMTWASDTDATTSSNTNARRRMTTPPFFGILRRDTPSARFPYVQHSLPGGVLTVVSYP